MTITNRRRIKRLHADLILFAGGLLLGCLLATAFAVGWATTQDRKETDRCQTP